jgi:DNA-binding transcriptional ArsR family regulator
MVTHERPRKKERPRTESAFGAIADPTRRAILDLVRQRELSAGDIARRFPVSRPAIAKHVRVLRQAGLLRERREATQRFYRLEPAALQAVDQWLAPYRLFWAARLVDLKRVVEAEAKAKPRKKKGES